MWVWGTYGGTKTDGNGFRLASEAWNPSVGPKIPQTDQTATKRSFNQLITVDAETGTGIQFYFTKIVLGMH